MRLGEDYLALPHTIWFSLIVICRAYVWYLEAFFSQR